VAKNKRLSLPAMVQLVDLRTGRGTGAWIECTIVQVKRRFDGTVHSYRCTDGRRHMWVAADNVRLEEPSA
jgi:hypothetical protein